MHDDVKGWYDAQKLEARMQRFWAEARIFDKLREKNAGGEPWSFLDGPITANNPMGIHHAWGRSLKDAFQRYHAMRGRHQRYQNGFDCQGLWVEVEVEKELGLGSKREIESYGVERFVQACKDRVATYAQKITEQSIRLGSWMDWDNSYYTMSDENNYAIWAFLKKCHERGLIYKGHDVMPWCPRCGTGISQHEMQEGYREVAHRGAVVTFPIAGRPREHFLAWTTTPWTLPANVALAVNPEEQYAAVAVGDGVYYLAAKRVAPVMEGRRARLLGARSGAEVVASGWSYVGPFDDLPAWRGTEAAHRVLAWPEVSAEEGTGVVHVAPGCGPEDFALGREHGLPSPCPIDEDGRFVAGHGTLQGRTTAQASEQVLTELRGRGLLFASETHRHSYPHCWRCATELVYRLVDEWFISVNPWREDVLRNAASARWIPSFGRELEMDWLRNMRDWMISKKRYWGLALPIWECAACSCFDVIGSREELRRRAVAGWGQFDGKSPHRPQVDAITVACPRCGGPMSRVPDVGNPWLDAGIVPFSTTGYSSGSQAWRTWVPADLVLEGFQQQFRNWFYSLLAMGTVLENMAPFRALLGHASVNDERGNEMHKSQGNAIWFDDAVAEAGADTIRWYFSSRDPATNVDFSFRETRRLRGGFFNTLWNCHAFYCTYARLAGFTPSAAAPSDVRGRADLEQWILSRLHSATARCGAGMDDFDTRRLTREVEGLVESLSNVYVRHRRRMFWKDADSPQAVQAYLTLYECLSTIVRLAAPVAPHISEAIYQNLVRPADPQAPESVHLSAYPVPDESLARPDLEEAMELTSRAVQAALSARREAGIKVRQPLAALEVLTSAPEGVPALERFADLLRGEANVHELRLAAGDAEGSSGWMEFPGGKLLLDTRLTPELRREGLARELIRRLQVLRKEAGLSVEERITVTLATDSAAIREALAEHRKLIAEELLCLSIEEREPEGDVAVLDVEGAQARVAVRRAATPHIACSGHGSRLS